MKAGLLSTLFIYFIFFFSKMHSLFYFILFFSSFKVKKKKTPKNNITLSTHSANGESSLLRNCPQRYTYIFRNKDRFQTVFFFFFFSPPLLALVYKRDLIILFTPLLFLQIRKTTHLVSINSPLNRTA